MRVTEDDLRLLTTESPDHVEAVFNQLNSDVEALKRQIQKNKQVLSVCFCLVSPLPFLLLSYPDSSLPNMPRKFTPVL